MTGKELMLYILTNDLENEEVISNDKIVGLITDEEAAIKYGVGKGTIWAWHTLGKLKGFVIGNRLFIADDIVIPTQEARKSNEK